MRLSLSGLDSFSRGIGLVNGTEAIDVVRGVEAMVGVFLDVVVVVAGVEVVVVVDFLAEVLANGVMVVFTFQLVDVVVESDEYEREFKPGSRREYPTPQSAVSANISSVQCSTQICTEHVTKSDSKASASVPNEAILNFKDFESGCSAAKAVDRHERCLTVYSIGTPSSLSPLIRQFSSRKSNAADN